MNDFSQIEPDSEIRDLARIQADEARDMVEAWNSTYDREAYDGSGWPGDGSGTDDLADYNANEANDYQNE